MSDYNKRPSTPVANSKGRIFRGDREILSLLQSELAGESRTLIVETYPGVSEDKVRRMLGELHPNLIVSAKDMLKDAQTMEILLDNILTKDRVFGRMYSGELTDFVDFEKVEELRKEIDAFKSFGAGIVAVCTLRIIRTRISSKSSSRAIFWNGASRTSGKQPAWTRCSISWMPTGTTIMS